MESDSSLARGPEPETVTTWLLVATFYGGLAYAIFEMLRGASIGNAIASAVDVMVPLIAIAFGAAVFYSLFFRRERVRRQRVTERVAATLEEHDEAASGDGHEGENLAREAAGDSKYDELADIVAESFRTVKSPQLVEVEEFIRRFPPRFPRGAKRMLNHARLLTKIAREREMFGGDPDLTPAHLGKWIVIGERWPAFAQQVIRRPDKIGQIEDHGPGDSALEDVPTDREFKEMMKADPRLAEVVERLIYFTPARDGDAVPVAS